MNILWIKSDFPLPADTGGKIRTYELMRRMAKRCQITLLCYAPPDLEDHWRQKMLSCGIDIEIIQRREEVKRGLRFVLRVMFNLLSRNPYIVNKYVTDEMKETVERLVRDGAYDIVLCDFLEMAWCGEYATTVPRVLFEHNVETVIWRRYYNLESNPFKKLYFLYEKGRLKRFESEACASADLVLTVSEEDGRILDEEFGAGKYAVIPTAVDVDYFHPREGEITGRIVFCGSMDWMPNIDAFWWFYKSIFPFIKQEVQDLSFTVVGRRPGQAIVEVGRRDKDVTVTGTVEDVRPHVSKAQIYIVPLRIGGGTRLKIFEAMAMRKCVVSTQVGAEGLPVTDGEDIVIANDEGGFAERVLELLRNDEKRDQIANTAYELVKQRLSWDMAVEALYRALYSVAREGGAAPS